MKLVRILLAATLLASVFSFSNGVFQAEGDVRDYDGVGWLGFPEGMKIGYVTGLIIGVHLTTDQISLLADDFQKEKLDKISLHKITVGQIRDGVETFYKDFSNRKVKVVDAIYVVKMLIGGVVKEVIEAQIRYLKMQPLPVESFLIVQQKYDAYQKKIGRLD